ncbi:hypothetical protein ABEB36_012700 [Hypothenemus hampei]|uniref:Uncharacterized protein n=1 Tax=Hypothenemus hampei TaxID=57062 RepID=A0ABD1EC55_HYPHA
MLIDAELPISYWVAAVSTAVYLINHSPRINRIKMPFKLYYRKELNIKDRLDTTIETEKFKTGGIVEAVTEVDIFYSFLKNTEEKDEEEKESNKDPRRSMCTRKLKIREDCISYIAVETDNTGQQNYTL